MFIRKKTTPLRHTVVQIVENHRHGPTTVQHVLRHVGTAKNAEELEQLLAIAATLKTQMEQAMLAQQSENALGGYASAVGNWQEMSGKEKVNLHYLEETARTILGIHDVYGAVYEHIGFSNLFTRPQQRTFSATILREIVLGRIAHPSSKRDTVNFLSQQFGKKIKIDHVYQMMDKIDTLFLERIQKCALAMTLKLSGQKLRVMFYDATTLYFESFQEDALKQNGYSKDMKFNQPQIVLTLFVTESGLPVGYEIFPGATFEGHTLIPVLEKLKSRYNIKDVIFVADRDLLSESNLTYLAENNVNYIVGARIKGVDKKLKTEILNPANYHRVGEEAGHKIAIFEQDPTRRLIVSYSMERHRKDQHDRLKAIEKLQKKLAKSKNPKSLLSNYGYKKYLEIQGDATVHLNTQKLKQDAQWDGLLGVTTNLKEINAEQVLAQYRSLWQIEACFRVNKHDLKMRPIYHWTPHRVQAHVAICFMAFVCVKYLEYRLSVQSKGMSPEVIRQSLLQVQASTLYDRHFKKSFILPSQVSREAKEIYRVMGIKIPNQPVVIK